MFLESTDRLGFLLLFFKKSLHLVFKPVPCFPLPLQQSWAGTGMLSQVCWAPPAALSSAGLTSSQQKGLPRGDMRELQPWPRGTWSRPSDAR